LARSARNGERRCAGKSAGSGRTGLPNRAIGGRRVCCRTPRAIQDGSALSRACGRPDHHAYDGKTLLETTQFQGLFDLDRLDRGRRAVFRPKTDLAALFPLKAGKKATVEFEVEAAGRPPTSAIQISVKGTDVLYIGACKYSVLKIERSESRGGSAFAFNVTDYYSPDLKIIIAKEYKDSDTKTTLIKYDRIYPSKQ
jgi:hypothetical protein